LSEGLTRPLTASERLTVSPRRLVAALVPLALAVTFVSTGTAESQVPQQSPINVTAGSIRLDLSQPRLTISYPHAEVELEYIRKDQASPTGCATRDHEETEEGIVPDGVAYVTVAGVRYDLKQFHFHTPAEHHFGGRADPMEMHLVHQSAAGKLLVIGVPLRAGAPSAVDKVLAKLAPECGETVPLHDVNLNALLPGDHTTFRYQGSLTTAPFTEGVQWFLMNEKTVSQATITRFQSLFTSGDARGVQPLNGRTVTAVPQF